MANDIVAQLQENLGMNINIQVWPEASWRPELFKNEFQLVWIRWWYDYPDPNNGYGDMFYSQKVVWQAAGVVERGVRRPGEQGEGRGGSGQAPGDLQAS